MRVLYQKLKVVKVPVFLQEAETANSNYIKDNDAFLWVMLHSNVLGLLSHLSMTNWQMVEQDTILSKKVFILGLLFWFLYSRPCHLLLYLERCIKRLYLPESAFHVLYVYIELEPIAQALYLSKNLTLISQYWLVSGTDSSMIYISRIAWFKIKLPVSNFLGTFVQSCLKKLYKIFI